MLFGFQKELGWTQLMNEHVTLSHGLASIEILPPFSNRANLKKAMKGIVDKKAFKILLTHDPHLGARRL